MSYTTHEQVMNRVKEHHQIALDMGYEVIGTFLQGSFNYGENMSDKESDVDTKCLVVPTFKDFCLNAKTVSFTHICDNNEHIDIKDFRLYFQCFKKQNINFVEILFTDYKVINPKYTDLVQMLIDNREAIGHYDNKATLNCMCGMAMEKLKALEHPYPATKDKIEKYGFDGKQLSHIIRLAEFMKRWVDGESYADCLISKTQPLILAIKRNRVYNLESARIEAKTWSEEMKVIKDEYMSTHDHIVDTKVDELFDNLSIAILEKYLREELNNDSIQNVSWASCKW